MYLLNTLKTVRSLMDGHGMENEPTVNAIKVYEAIQSADGLKRSAILSMNMLSEFKEILKKEGYLDKYPTILRCTYNLTNGVVYENDRLVLTNDLELLIDGTPNKITCRLEIAGSSVSFHLISNDDRSIIKPIPFYCFNSESAFTKNNIICFVTYMSGEDLKFFNKETLNFVKESLEKFYDELVDFNLFFDKTMDTLIKVFHADHVLGS